jgi:hypothetical protein
MPAKTCMHKVIRESAIRESHSQQESHPFAREGVDTNTVLSVDGAFSAIKGAPVCV